MLNIAFMLNRINTSNDLSFTGKSIIQNISSHSGISIMQEFFKCYAIIQYPFVFIFIFIAQTCTVFRILLTFGIPLLNVYVCFVFDIIVSLGIFLTLVVPFPDKWKGQRTYPLFIFKMFESREILFRNIFQTNNSANLIYILIHPGCPTTKYETKIDTAGYG